MLPTLIPAVSVTRRLRSIPCPALHLTDVSESHELDSHLVTPTLALPVVLIMLMLTPCRVTNADPVLALLLGLATLNKATSNDHISLAVPVR